MSFLVALVGRANVGKSMIFNRLTLSKDALVANFPGLTRDRKYGSCKVGDANFTLVDTGGLELDATGVVQRAYRQVEKAIFDADLVALVVDANSGLNAHDETFAEYLRKLGKQVFLIINKIDGVNQDLAIAEFAPLAIENAFCISAKNNRGISKLVKSINNILPLEDRKNSQLEQEQQITENSLQEQEFATEAVQDTTQNGEQLQEQEFPQYEVKEEKPLHICLAGRPNVGKSTLINTFLGEERQVVFNEPGTTRDSIEVSFTKSGKEYVLVDTAGIRRRKQVKHTIEKFSIQKTKNAVKASDVVILLIEADLGLVDQDVSLLNFVLESGKPLILAVNKTDKLSRQALKALQKRLKEELHFADFVPIHFISASSNTGLSKLLQETQKAYSSAIRVFNKRDLNAWLEMLLRENPTPKFNNRHIKLRYIHQIGNHPPHLLIHGKKTDDLPQSYKSYIKNNFYRLLNLSATPLVIEYRTDENPFTEREQG